MTRRLATTCLAAVAMMSCTNANEPVATSTANEPVATSTANEPVATSSDSSSTSAPRPSISPPGTSIRPVDETPSASGPLASVAPLPVGADLRPLPMVPIRQEVATEDDVVFRAVEAQVQGCMAEQGFDYVPAEPQTSLEFDATDGMATMMDHWSNSRNDGSNDEASGDGGEDQLQRANPAWEALDSDAERQAWERAYDGTVVGQMAREGGVTVDFPDGSGELPGGCFGQAQEAAVPDRVKAWQLQDEFERVYNSALERVESHPVVQEVAREWSQCLAERGFDYASPHDALEGLGGSDDPLGPAVGDCAVEVNWARRVNPVEVEVHEQIIAENEGLIASLADQREAARQRARELLGEG